MSKYRRNLQKGGCYFFTVVTYSRKKILLQKIERLRAAFAIVMRNHPFKIDGIVILPDHLHCIWNLPENDDNYSLRWRLIKHHFSRGFDLKKIALVKKKSGKEDFGSTQYAMKTIGKIT